MLVKYKWTGFNCCERYVFKYLELKEKDKKGEGRKKVIFWRELLTSWPEQSKKRESCNRDTKI